MMKQRLKFRFFYAETNASRLFGYILNDSKGRIQINRPEDEDALVTVRVMFIYSRILNGGGGRGRGVKRRPSVLDQTPQDSWFTTQFLIYLFTIFLYRIHSAVISMQQQSWSPLLEGRRKIIQKQRTRELKKKNIKKKPNKKQRGVKRNLFL